VSEALLEVQDLKTFFYRRGRFGVVKLDDYVAAVATLVLRRPPLGFTYSL